MGLRIRTNVVSLSSQRQVSTNTTEMSQSMEKLASGYRINRASDDSAGLAISETLKAKTRGLSQAKRNANDAISMVQVAEGAMNEMGNMLTRMRELTVQAATDTIGDKERSYLNREYVQLADELDRIAGTTEFNGNKFFLGEGEHADGQYTIQVGNNATSQDVLTLDMKGLRFGTQDLNIGKEAEIGPTSTSEAPKRADITQKLTVLDDALTRLASERASIGATQSRLTSTINNLSINVENMEGARSRIVDTDFAVETANLAKYRVLSQASMSVMSQANQAPDMALSLLR